MTARPRSRLRRILKSRSSGSGSGSINGHNNKLEIKASEDSSSSTTTILETESSSTASSTPTQCDAEEHENLLPSYELSSSSTTPCTDPYSDVRERMERLAANDRAKIAYHDVVEDDDELIHHRHHQQHHNQRYEHNEPQIPPFAAFTTYLGYVVLIAFGHIRDICAKIIRKGRYLRRNTNFPSDDQSMYAILLKSWENFYTRRLYHRIQDCFNRPIASNPGAHIDVLERISSDGNKTMTILGNINNLSTNKQKEEYTKSKHYRVVSPGNRVARHCLNLGSYNYLGFADDWDVTCREGVMNSLEKFPVSMSSCRMEYGTTSLHDEVERIVANLCGKEAALVLNMGFNTNATTIPALVGSDGDLLISDSLNHTSIVNGARASGASIRTFRHNDIANLDFILREAIIMGRPRTRRPWNKIMVITEGIYSMEGEYCNLRDIVRVCKKYGAYIYLDEAHSIGAMGASGRGVTEYMGVDPADIDIMMGTFTKSFGGMGGYIAGSKDIIDYLRDSCAASSYHNSLSPVVCQQIISALKVIIGQDGTSTGKRKLQALRDNSNYFRMRLTDMGLHVLGHYDSPIMPVMLYNPTKIAAFSRECFKRGLAVVVVGFPAVPILMSRARFCISAGHTRDDLDRALREIDEIADILKLRYARSTFG